MLSTDCVPFNYNGVGCMLSCLFSEDGEASISYWTGSKSCAANVGATHFSVHDRVKKNRKNQQDSTRLY